MLFFISEICSFSTFKLRCILKFSKRPGWLNRRILIVEKVKVQSGNAQLLHAQQRNIILPSNHVSLLKIKSVLRIISIIYINFFNESVARRYPPNLGPKWGEMGQRHRVCFTSIIARASSVDKPGNEICRSSTVTAPLEKFLVEERDISNHYAPVTKAEMEEIKCSLYKLN